MAGAAGAAAAAAAVAAAVAAAALADVNTLLTACGITDANVRNAIVHREGFLTVEDLAVLESDTDVTEMAKRMAGRTAAEGRAHLSTVQIKRLQAMVWWIHDRRQRSLDINVADFTPAAMDAARERKRIEQERPETEASVKDLSKFDPDHFKVHEDAFMNWLAQTYGVRKEPLRYIVRPEEEPDVFTDDAERRMFQIPLTGDGYEEDNRAVYRKLKAFLINTAGWAWIEPYNASENGREAFWAWSNHYNGQGELSKRTALAKASLVSLHYRNERSMSFERYTELLSRAFTTLDKDPDEAKSERQKVETLVNGIKVSEGQLQGCLAVIMDRYPSDFTQACAYFSSYVARIHGGAQLENKRYRKRQISGLGTHPRGGRGRGRYGGRYGGRYNDRGGRGAGRDGRGGRGRLGPNRINGVDVSDPTRAFTAQEWEALARDGGRAYVWQARERIAGRGRGRDGGRFGPGQQPGRNIAALGYYQPDPNQQQPPPAPAPAPDAAGRGLGDRGGRNGRGFGRGAYQQH